MKNQKILLLVLLAPLIAQGNVFEKPNYTLVYAKAGEITSYTYDAATANKPLNSLIIATHGGSNNITIKGKLGDNPTVPAPSTFETHNIVRDITEGDYKLTYPSSDKKLTGTVLIADGSTEGNNTITFENVTIDNHAAATGIQTYDQIKSKIGRSLSPALLTFKGVNTINTHLDDDKLTKAEKEQSNGIQLLNNSSRVGEYHVRSEKDSTLNINVKSGTHYSRGISINHYNNTTGSTNIDTAYPTKTMMEYDGDVNIKVERNGHMNAENYGVVLSARNSKRNRGHIPDDSKMEVTFRGNLTIDVTPVYDDKGNPKSIGDAINVDGKNSKVDIVGEPDKVVQIKGDIHAYNSGVVNVNLGNENSYFEGEAHIGKQAYTSKQNLFDETVDADDNVMLNNTRDIERKKKEIDSWTKSLNNPTVSEKLKEKLKKQIADTEAEIQRSKEFFDENGIIKNDVIDNTKNAINLTMSNGARWKVTNDSMIKELDLSKGAVVEFGNDKKFVNVSVKNLKGDTGTLKMYGDIVKRESDQLITRKSSEGTHIIEYEDKDKDKATAKTTGKEYLKLVENRGDEKDNKAIYKLNIRCTEQGAYCFSIGESTDSKIADIKADNKHDFYLHPATLSSWAQAAVVLNDLIYQSNLTLTESLHQRLGEVHFNKEIVKQQNVWVKSLGGEYVGTETVKVRGYTNRYRGLKAGYDWIKARGNWINYNGLSFGYINSTARLNTFGGKIHIYGKELGLYSSWLNKENDLYLDFWAKAIRYRGGYNVINYSNKDITSPNIMASTYIFSSEMGKRFNLSQNAERVIYFQPEAQLSYHATNGYSFKTSHDASVKTERMRSLVGRIGFRAGLDYFNEKNLHPYIKLMYEREFLGEMQHTFNEVAVEKFSNRGSWWVYGFGLSYMNKTKNTQLYFEAQRSSTHNFKQNWQAHLGVRYLF